jgi:hypothetical protein
MFYSPFTQVLSNPELKPIDIILLGGNIFVQTHPGDEIYIAGENMPDENLMPLLHEDEHSFRVDRHSLLSFIWQKEREKSSLKIFIPETCNVSILLRGGNINVKGKYGQFRARADAGNITADLNDFSVKGQADLVVFAGEIKLVNSAAFNPTKKGERKINMKIGEEGTLNARVSLGDVCMA